MRILCPPGQSHVRKDTSEVSGGFWGGEDSRQRGKREGGLGPGKWMNGSPGKAGRKRLEAGGRTLTFIYLDAVLFRGLITQDVHTAQR
jgi:hypothetical protein